MSGVHRFTTRYDQVEDRIKLLVETKAGEVQVLLLTRRLLNRLLPALLKGLAQAPAVQEVPRPQAQTAQRFAQAAAVSSITRQKDVVPSEETPQKEQAYLVSSIDLHRGKSNVTLDFKAGDQLLQSVPLGEDGLRQWLNMVFRQYKAGEWAEPFWPKWMTHDQTSADVRLN